MSANQNAVRPRLRGVAAALLTPFEESGTIEHHKIEENATALYESGMRTNLAAANISEYHLLTSEERIAVTESSVSALSEDACVLAGVGGSTGAARELYQLYEAIGVDALIIMPPNHTYLHQEGLLIYYRELAAASETPLVPYIRGFNPSVEFLTKLCIPA